MSQEFYYKAIDKNGKVVSGFMHAEDEIVLGKNLKSDELNLIFVETSNKWNLNYLKIQLKNIGTVSMHDKIIVYRNLSAMLNAGLPLSRALFILQKQSKNQKLKDILGLINENVKKGGSLSESLEKFPKIFSSLMVSMVRSGEESGNLVQALDVTADQMEKSYSLQKKIKGAMVYPSVIISAMIVIAFFMLIYVVPTLVSTFSELNIELPKTTQFIILISNLLQNNLLLFFVALLSFIVLFSFSLKTKIGKKIFHYTILHLPLISPLVKEINSARTTRTLASLLSSGVPLVRSLEIVKEVIQNSYYKKIIEKAEKNIQLGLPLSKVFTEAEDLYPVFVGEMMAVGEETGDLGNMLLKVAVFYENEVDEKTKNMSTIIEPVLMIFVGIAVGFFALSMISPMYSLVEKM